MVLGIYGAGGLGREVLELAKCINCTDKKWEKFVFIVDGAASNVVNGINVYSYEQAIEEFGASLEIILGIGEPSTRERLLKKITNDRISLATLIHPNVYIPDSTTVGKGVVIQVGCFISCNVFISDNVFIQPHATIGHDDRINEGAIVSSFCGLSGNVSVGKHSYIGVGTVVREGVAIGDYSIIGMASAVYKDIPDEMIAMGNPARPMKRNEEHHVFG